MISGELGVGSLFRHFPRQIATTWFLVLIENLLLALIPLFIGRAIDALLIGEQRALIEVISVMGALVLVAVTRRVYDTRAYGSMRVQFGAEFMERNRESPVSETNARLDMSREMVDFLEEHVPELLTALMQIIVSIVLLWSFGWPLGISAVTMIFVSTVVYALFHRTLFRLNGRLNARKERQVHVLESRQHGSLMSHLISLRKEEVRLSDIDALLYSLIFIGMFAFVLINLWFASLIPAITAGMVFTILSYSWALVDAGIALPLTLQQWTRLSEIKHRLNN